MIDLNKIKAMYDYANSVKEQEDKFNKEIAKEVCEPYFKARAELAKIMNE